MGALVPDVTFAAQPRLQDLDQCRAYGESDVVVLARPQAPVVVHVSGERIVERARQELARVEADVARTRALLNPEQRVAHDAALDLRVFEAKNDLTIVEAMYPPPMDLTFVPLSVERILRGTPREPLLARLIDPATRLAPERLYLIRGMRSTDVIPSAEMLDTPLSQYVNVSDAMEGASARAALQFLESTASGVTILGHIRMETSGPRPTGDQAYEGALAGTRVRATGDRWQAEVLVGADGTFAFENIPQGQISRQPLLPAGLTLVGGALAPLYLRAGDCAVDQLVAQHNGRVRGRIANAHELAVAGITLSLDAGLSPGERPGEVRMSSHAVHHETRLEPDGTFEFAGVAPGFYTLSARYPQTPGIKPPFAVTYSPGTQALENAIRIEVGTGTVHDGFDFSLVVTDPERQCR